MACSKITIKLVVCIELEIFSQSVPVWDTRGHVNLTLSGRPLKLWDLWGLGYKEVYTCYLYFIFHFLNESEVLFNQDILFSFSIL